MVRISSRSLVVLVGASASGKSTWALEHFRHEQVVSSDALRAVVGQSSGDQRASKDAFELLERIVAARTKRGLLTVIDTTGLDAGRRAAWRDLAVKHGLDSVAVTFPTPAKACKSRNRARRYPVPGRVLDGQLRTFAGAAEDLTDEGWTVLEAPDEIEVVPPAFVAAPRHHDRQRSDPVPLRFGLSLPSYDFPGDTSDLGPQLAEVALAAEQAGFTSLWVMDHVVQIPSFGAHYDRMLDSYTTLAWLAARTSTIELGALVTGITYRNVAHLGKIVATLDVLSGGRAWCGLGAAWYEREHAAYGWEFPPDGSRLDLLEDALQLLPALWGPGTKPFEGTTIQLPETTCYPRPLRDPRPPILVGGSGERRTLRLVAEYADACNLLGDVELVRQKVAVLDAHCAEVGRDRAEILVTQLGHALTGRDAAEVASLVAAAAPRDRAPETVAAALNAGTVADQIGRYRELADAGVGLAVLDLPPVASVEAIERFAPVIAAFA